MHEQSNSVCSSNKLGLAILEALGIDHEGVTCLTLKCEAGTLASLSLEMTVRESAQAVIAEVIKQYRLEAVNEATDGSSPPSQQPRTSLDLSASQRTSL